MTKIIYRLDIRTPKGSVVRYFDTEQEARSYGDKRKNYSGWDYGIMKWRSEE
jgi:hypothetical protein